jgi:hypothetical protein
MLSRDDGQPALAEFVAIALILALAGRLIYWLNQCAVREQLEPRRQELQTLLRSLNESGEALNSLIDKGGGARSAAIPRWGGQSCHLAHSLAPL